MAKLRFKLRKAALVEVGDFILIKGDDNKVRPVSVSRKYARIDTLRGEYHVVVVLGCSDQRLYESLHDCTVWSSQPILRGRGLGS